MPKILDNPREAVLSFAKEIIINDGIEQLTMREVSKKSGIAVGTIYNYFPTKKDLLLHLIESYWYEYYELIEKIDKEQEDLFSKLREIYNKMDSFVETFKVTWVKNHTSEYTEDGIKRKDIFLEKLYKKLENIIQREVDRGTIQLSIEISIIAKFIICNFMMMAQMKQFTYADFDKIIKDYLSVK